MKTFGRDRQVVANQSNGDAGSSGRACPACGTAEHRGTARFCLACGRELEDVAYRPAVALQASYHVMTQRQTARRQNSSNKSMRERNLSKTSPPNNNGASSTAMAFVTYALVPYLGILFCPGAVLMGGIGLIRQWRVPKLGGRNASYAGVVFGITIFGAQVFLWWILYKVPQWAIGVEF